MRTHPENENPAALVGSAHREKGNNSTANISPNRGTPQQRWAEKNPLKRWAHVATASAIKRGLLVRQPCQECGDERSDFHHPDHRFPLVGVWVCRAHHKAIEKRLKAEGGGT